MCLCGLAALVSRKVSGLGWEAMAFKHRRGSPGCRDRSRRKEFRQMRSQLTAERSGLAGSIPRPMCGRGSVAGVAGPTSPRFCKASTSRRFTRRIKNGTLAHRLRVAGEERKSQEQEEIKRLRAQVELLSKQQGTEKSPEEPCEPARRGSGLEEGCKMEVVEETRKSWRSKRKACSGSCGISSMDKVFRDRQEVWKEQLKEIEMKRTELLLEHQKNAQAVTKVAELAG